MPVLEQFLVPCCTYNLFIYHLFYKSNTGNASDLWDSLIILNISDISITWQYADNLLPKHPELGLVSII